MFTRTQVEYLLRLPKELENKGQLVVDLAKNKNRFHLVSPDDDDWEFLVDITNNKRISFRISFHHQEDTTKEGLLRIDFKSGHRNPDIANEFVPDFLHPYVGYWFDNEAHIHFFVEGYKELAWAMPLKDYKKFTVLDIDSYEDFSNAVLEFAKEINLKSHLNIQQAII